MTRWFRYYDDALNDPKVQRLSGELFKSWVNLLCLASKSGGELASLHDVAFALRLPEIKAAAVVTELATKGLLDRIDDRYFAPHKWSDRQFKSDGSTERVKRFRKQERNVSCNVSETETKRELKRSKTENGTGPESDTEQNRKKEDICSAGARAKIRPEAFSISDDCYRILGIELEAVAPEWCGLAYQIDMMLTRGYDPPNILATFAKLAGQKPLKPMNYFIKAVESSQQNRIKPAGAPNAKSGNICEAADRLIAKLAYFDEPAPESARVCGGAGETPIRAIPSG